MLSELAPGATLLALVVPLLAGGSVLVLGGSATHPPGVPGRRVAGESRPDVVGREDLLADDGPTVDETAPRQQLLRRGRAWVEERLHRVRGVPVELQVLDDLASALDAGLPVHRAVRLSLSHVAERSGSHPQAWAMLERAAEEGQSLGTAWSRVARATGSPALTSVARAWRVASLTGAPLAEALRMSSRTARERLRLERAVETATAGARATATVLTLLPLAGVVLAGVLGVPPTELYGHPVAWASLGVGALLLLAGQGVVRRLVGRVLRDLQ